MTLYIVRHGETEENRLNVCQGQTHGTLTREGMEEAHHIGRRLSEVHFDACYASDLYRAYKTAEIIASEHSESLHVIADERLRERYFGSFQGKRFPQPGADDFFFSEAELPAQIADRLRDFLSQVSTRHPGGTLLIVSHGFTIRVLLALLHGLTAEEWPRMPELLNTSLTIARGPEPYTFVLTNDTAHLPDRSCR